MGKVKIYADIGNVMNEGNYMTIRKSSEYIVAYEFIQKAIYNKENLNIVIKNKYCLSCLEKMKNLYGDEYIEICTYSPKKELQELLKVNIPEYIDESDILKSGILDKYHDFQISSGMSFEDIIISNYLSSFLTTDKFPFKNLFNIINSLDFKSFNENLRDNLINKIYNNKINLWKKCVANESELNILNKFATNPEEIYKELSKYILILNYPKELSIKVLGDISKDYIRIDIKSDPFIHDNVELTEVKDNIRIYLNSIKKDNMENEEILNIIKMTSGILVEEFNFVVEMLKDNRNSIDRNMINYVKKKFYQIANINSEYDEILDNIIPPKKPLEPEKDYKVDRWLKWAKNEYFDYRFWMEENNQVDESVDEFSNEFGIWMYKNYNDLIFEQDHMIFNAIKSISSDLKSDELSILLVIDNFNYKYVSLINELFREEGFSNTLDKSLLSMLPSETSISKACLFRGDVYDYDNNKSYDKLCNEWQTLLKKPVKYVSGIGDLKSELSKEADIYIVNYLEIDTILHRNQKAFAQSTRSKVKEELKALVKVVSTFVKRIGFENKVKVYVCSDHGCTKIIKDKENYINKNYYKGKCDDASHRFVTISDENMSKLSSNIEDFCYVLDRNIYSTKENYLIAKNYYRFLETNENFYVHGGITPEETVIPFLKFERVNIDVKYPLIAIKQNEFRSSVKTNINLEISNANEYEIKHLVVSILNTNIKGTQNELDIDNIDKLDTINITFNDLRITKNDKNNNEKILLRIKFNLLDKEFEKDYEIPIVIKSMMENKMNLDDLF